MAGPGRWNQSTARFRAFPGGAHRMTKAGGMQMNTAPMRDAWRKIGPRLGPYHLRPLHWWEAGEVAKLERLVFLEPLSRLSVAARLMHPGTVYAGVFDGQRLAAYFGFSIWGAYAHVLANVTHPDYRRRGLADALLRIMEPVARAGGARGFLGEVRPSNSGQQRILQALGWKEVFVISGFFQNGENALIVWRSFEEARPHG